MHLAEAEPDLLREMVRSFIDVIMGAEVDALCGASYGERTPEQVNRRNSYRERSFDTRVGTLELGHPQAALGELLSRLAARAPQALGAGAGVGGGRVLPARCL